MSATALLLATRSEGKIREITPMFAAAGLTLVSLHDLGISESDEEYDLECYDTFEENALAKARYFYEISGGIPTVADDSGLEVEPLGGHPGVASKRWSGRTDLHGASLDAANNEKLVTAVAGHERPAARYVCVAAYVAAGLEITTRGETAGTIIQSPRGIEGFGYDPHFFSSELERTFGESSVAEKEAVSHRGRAFRALLSRIRSGR